MEVPLAFAISERRIAAKQTIRNRCKNVVGIKFNEVDPVTPQPIKPMKLVRQQNVKYSPFEDVEHILFDYGIIIQQENKVDSPTESLGHAVMALKQGISPMHRASTWELVLNSVNGDPRNLIIDSKKRADTNASIHDLEDHYNDQYFLFKDLIVDIVNTCTADECLCLSEDKIPYLKTVASPVCYITNDTELATKLVKLLYRNHWRVLPLLSNEKSPMKEQLCRVFGTLFKEYCPKQSYHLNSQALDPSPMVLSWFNRAFVGFLSAQEVLKVWDLVIAYNNVSILSIIAVSIFSIKSVQILRVHTKSDLELVLHDIDQLLVAPALKCLISQIQNQG